MKEHSVSHSTAPPASVKITYNSTVDELMTDWLAERVQKGIEFVINEAATQNVSIKEIWVAGHQSYEEPTREIWVTVETDATHDAVRELHGILATNFYHLNETPPPGAANADVTVQVAVNW
jgi:hypothetical protein